MLTFLIRRALISLALLALISIISWLIISLTPGSPMPWSELNPKITPQTRELYIKKFHFDKPWHKQYALMMRDLAQGKLVSNKDERPVLAKIGERIPATLLLNLTSLAMAFCLGIPLGIWAARHFGKWQDHVATVLAFLAISLPGFWVSYLLCIALVKWVQVPVLGLTTFNVQHASWWSKMLDVTWHLFAPAFVMAVGAIAVESRYLRASLLEALNEDYIRTAHAKGLSRTVVLYKHALRNSLRPLLTGIGLLLPGLIGGSVIIESIFGYPGMGRLAYQAVMERDYPIILTVNLIAAILVLAGNLLADILYAAADPRVRLE